VSRHWEGTGTPSWPPREPLWVQVASSAQFTYPEAPETRTAGILFLLNEFKSGRRHVRADKHPRPSRLFAVLLSGLFA